VKIAIINSRGVIHYCHYLDGLESILRGKLKDDWEVYLMIPNAPSLDEMLRRVAAAEAVGRAVGAEAQTEDAEA